MNSDTTLRLKLFIIVAVCGFFLFAFSVANPIAAFDVSQTDRSGARVYSDSCSSCHGADGSGNTRRGKRKGASDLRKSKISVGKGIRIITNGQGNMPSFKDALSKGEISAVNTYVRGFRGN